MNANSSVIGTSEAAKMLGVSPRYIQKKIKDGELSATRDKARKYIIDKSEFYRVFPDAKLESTTTNNFAEYSQNAELRYIELLLQDKDSQISFLKSQLEQSIIEKNTFIDTLNNTQKLLEQKITKKRRKILGIF